MSRDKSKDLFSEIEERLGGVLGELGKALGEAITTFETGTGEVRRSQSFETTKGPVRAEAGLRVRLGGITIGETAEPHDPAPVNRPTGGQNETDRPKDRPRDITATIITHGKEWSLTAELPGVSKDDLTISVSDGRISINARGTSRDYAGTFDIPQTVTREDLNVSIQNGILDITASYDAESAP